MTHAPTQPRTLQKQYATSTFFKVGGITIWNSKFYFLEKLIKIQYLMQEMQNQIHTKTYESYSTMHVFKKDCLQKLTAHTHTQNVHTNESMSHNLTKKILPEDFVPDQA